ncbi:hypothetical protein J6590_038049 [Homalodisca vitripennis]|nr:hypothetical protein J6590_038049 [Homalodisca vitripennis]
MFKSGVKSFVKNYRPIFILSAVGKVSVSLVLVRVKPMFDQVIAEEQHGFRGGGGCRLEPGLNTCLRLANLAQTKVLHSPIRWLQGEGNSVAGLVDFFADSETAFRRSAVQCLVFGAV